MQAGEEGVGARKVIAAVLLLLSSSGGVHADESEKVYRVGYMSIPSRQSAGELIDRVFLPALRERGLVEGKNLLIEWRWAEGRPERLSGFATELAALNLDLIVAPQTDAALAAKQATHTVPIVHVLAGDPIADGLETNLAHPTGNVTGLTSTPDAEIYGKTLEMLIEATGASRAAVLWNPSRDSPSMQLGLRQLKSAASILGIQLQLFEARGPEEFGAAFAAIARARHKALLVVSDSTFWQYRRRMVELEWKYRLPTMHAMTDFATAGGLMAYGADLADLFRRSAMFIDKIVRGARPADLPIERPTKFELVINTKTAKALHLKIPSQLLLQADRLID
jgi:putative ABC transport system substrate-binding protein